MTGCAERATSVSSQFAPLLVEVIARTGPGSTSTPQAVDTTTPAGRAMYGMLGEREMIKERVQSGLDRVNAESRAGASAPGEVSSASGSADLGRSQGS